MVSSPISVTSVTSTIVSPLSPATFLLAIELNGCVAPSLSCCLTVSSREGFCAEMAHPALALFKPLAVKPVDPCLAPVCKEWFVKNGAFLVRPSMVARIQAGGLVEETGVVHCLVGGWLRHLSKSDPLGDIAIFVAPTLLLLTCKLQALISLNFSFSVIQHLHSLPPLLGVADTLVVSCSFGGQLCTLLARLEGKFSELLLPRFFVAHLFLPYHIITNLDFLSGFALGEIQVLTESSELVIHGHILEISAVCCQTLVQRYCVTFYIFPVRNAWRNLPVFLVLRC
mmetsp:Transcript_65212/g.172808  ORF Transcript_65212/g.172808 Transcript_65212/m.172808 type:complete len:284 (+) Transcript_65212:240-1091(+)